MGYDSRATLVTMLETVRANIEKAETAQSWGSGDTTLQRGNLNALYRREKQLLDKIEALDNQSSGGNVNLVEFNDAS